MLKKRVKYWLVLVKHYLKVFPLVRYCIESIVTISAEMLIN